MEEVLDWIRLSCFLCNSYHCISSIRLFIRQALFQAKIVRGEGSGIDFLISLRMAIGRNVKFVLVCLRVKVRLQERY